MTQRGISALFFPLVRYRGMPVRVKKKGSLLESPMLHCMLLCRFDEYQSPSPSFLPVDYLASVTCVEVRDEATLGWNPQPGEARAPAAAPSSSKWLQDLGLILLNGSVHADM